MFIFLKVFVFLQFILMAIQVLGLCH